MDNNEINNDKYIDVWINDIVNPNITSNVEFHNRYNIIIIPLLEQDQIIIIIDIIKKKLSKHKKIGIKKVELEKKEDKINILLVNKYSKR